MCRSGGLIHAAALSAEGGTDGPAGGPAAALTQHFSHKYTRIAGRVCADECGDVFRMDAFVRAPPPGTAWRLVSPNKVK